MGKWLNHNYGNKLSRFDWGVTQHDIYFDSASNCSVGISCRKSWKKVIKRRWNDLVETLWLGHYGSASDPVENLPCWRWWSCSIALRVVILTTFCCSKCKISPRSSSTINFKSCKLLLEYRRTSIVPKRFVRFNGVSNFYCDDKELLYLTQHCTFH